MKHPYVITQRRIDVVTKVPGWAEEYLKVGDEVVRTGPMQVEYGKGYLKLGESYTKFLRYSELSS